MAISNLTNSFFSIYISRLLGSKVHLSDQSVLGSIEDLLVLNGERAKIVGCLVKRRDGRRTLLDWAGFTIQEEDQQYHVDCNSPKEVTAQDNSIYLKKTILDKQIVDVDNKKLVRVNDIRLAFVASGAFAVAVDVGTAGLLRRLGMLGIIGSFYTIPSELILWSNIEVLIPQSRSIKLSVTQSKLSTLHPSDLSDIIEDLDANTRTEVFNSLDFEKAADVLEEMEDEAKVQIVENLSVEKAADVLEKMPSDEVADILSDLKEEKAQELLQEMESNASQEVRELMEYEEDLVGSLMSTDFFAFTPETTVGSVMHELRSLKPEFDFMYSIYVIDDSLHLKGEVSLRDVIISDPETPLFKIMREDPVFVYDYDDLDTLPRIISKYTPLSIPVLSEDQTLMGCVVMDDIIHEIFKNKRISL